MKQKFFKVLKRYHIPEKFARKHLLPADWSDKFFSNPAGYANAVDHLKSVLASFPTKEFFQ